MPLDEIVSRVKATYPDALLSSFSFPERADLALQIGASTRPQGSFTINLKRSAHTGDIFGAATRALYFITCLMLAGQVVTGFLIWWRRRQ